MNLMMVVISSDDRASIELIEGKELPGVAPSP